MRVDLIMKKSITTLFRIKEVKLLSEEEKEEVEEEETFDEDFYSLFTY